MADKQPQIELIESLEKQICRKIAIAITSDKGGPGKSTVSRTLSHVLLKKGISTLAFDADKRNADLFRYYHKAFSAIEPGVGVQRINLSQAGGADKLIDSFDSDSSRIVLIDFPAGGGELFERFDQEIKLLDLLQEVGFELTTVSVLNRGKNGINSLRTLIDYCGDRANYVVVRNLYFGEPEKFRRFDQSKTKERVLQQKGIVIDFPDLFDDTFDLLEEDNLSFSEALDPQKQVPYPDRRRIHVFLEKAEAEFMKAATYLGLGGDHVS